MTEIKSVHLPDLGTEDSVEIIEIAVDIGVDVQKEDTLLTLESEKASMDVPAPFSGKVHALKVKVGDKVKTGDLILELEVLGAKINKDTESPSKKTAETAVEVSKNTASLQQDSSYSIVVPDIGTEDLVSIIELNIKAGDELSKDSVLLTLESEKASMELPSPVTGVIKEVKVKEGQKVKQGDLIAQVKLSEEIENLVGEPKQESSSVIVEESKKVREQVVDSDSSSKEAIELADDIYASPAVRRLAREFGVDLQQVSGSGRKQRITVSDVQKYVKMKLQGADVGSGTARDSADLFVMPEIDFTKFGKTSEQELSRIKKISAKNLHRNWVNIPHVTQFDEADITDMEAFRQAHKEEVAKQGYKLTPIVFLMKAVVAALKEFPLFNTSLSSCGTKIIQKHYYHLGVAVDTPHGLMVPVIRDVDQKGLFTLAEELSKVSKSARELKITAAQMQGSCFTISSLGGLGGTAFTPIINAPDVAILGISKSKVKPVFINEEFQPRLLLPLSLSYDHRVIDGAQAAKFITFLSSRLKDLRCLLL